MKFLFFFFFFFFSVFSLKSQDTIISTNNKIVSCKIISEDSINVNFLIIKNGIDITSYISKKDVKKIIYEKILKYEDAVHNNLFKVYYVFGSISNSYHFNYERVLSPNSSISFSMGLPIKTAIYGDEARKDFDQYLNNQGFINFWVSSDWKFKHSIEIGYSFSCEIRYYIDKIRVNPKGLYIGGGINYFKMKDILSYTSTGFPEEIVINNEINQSILYLSLGIQIIPIHYLTIDFEAKPGYNFGDDTYIFNHSSSAGNFRFNFAVGLGLNF